MLWVEVDLDALECYEHDHIPAAESHKVSLEALVEGKESLVSCHVSQNSKKTARLAWSGIHDSSFEDVDR